MFTCLIYVLLFGLGRVALEKVVIAPPGSVLISESPLYPYSSGDKAAEMAVEIELPCGWNGKYTTPITSPGHGNFVCVDWEKSSSLRLSLSIGHFSCHYSQVISSLHSIITVHS